MKEPLLHYRMCSSETFSHHYIWQHTLPWTNSSGGPKIFQKTELHLPSNDLLCTRSSPSYIPLKKGEVVPQ